MDKKLNLIFNRPLTGKKLEDVISTLIESLIDIYVAANKDKNSQWFYEEIYHPCDIIARYPEGDVKREALKILSKINLPKPIIEHYKYSFICCMTAQGYVYQNNREMAWSLAADAASYLGSLFGTENVRRNYNEMSASVKSDRARDGGNKRSDRYNEYREIVYTMAKEQCPEGGKWKSLNYMSVVISGKLLKQIADSGKKSMLSTQSAANTVKGWLKKMPGIEALVNLPIRNKASLRLDGNPLHVIA